MMFGSKKQLAVFLSKLAGFEHPTAELEQYPTDSEIAAEILWTAQLSGELTGRRVADLGCGTGILGIGALALGASHVTFLEIDVRVFPTLMGNIAKLEDATGEEFGNYEILEGDVATFSTDADLVVQNPPFGTRDKGADTEFLRVAMKTAPLVYSLHKTSTEEHLRRIVTDARRRVLSVTRYAFPLKQTMVQHTKKLERIEVSCLKVSR